MAISGAGWFFPTVQPVGLTAPVGATCVLCGRQDMHMARGPGPAVHCWPISVEHRVAAACFPSSLFVPRLLDAFLSIYNPAPDDPSSFDSSDSGTGPSVDGNGSPSYPNVLD
jgi:hypothetical protein